MRTLGNRSPVSRALPILLAITLLVLVVDVTLVVSRTRTSSNPTSAPPPPQDLMSLVPELEQFVAKRRGLAFKSPVKVTLLDDRAFRDRLLGEQEEDLAEDDIDDYERLLKALKLVEQKVDLEAKADELIGDAVAGFYDPRKDELVVRGQSATPYVRGVLVHELTHALQDQHFDIERPELDERKDEVLLGLDAVLEGDALRIQDLYMRTLDDDSREQAQEEEAEGGDGIGEDIPEVLLNLLAFPYIVGPPFVEALIDEGGQKKLDAAFTTPPTTSEQLLHPERFLAGETAREVAPPPAAGEVFEEGMFGEFAFLLLFNEAMDIDEAREAADGWGGDYYVAWHDGKRTCIRIDVTMDRTRDQSQMVKALRTWAKHHGDAELTVGKTNRITACG